MNIKEDMNRLDLGLIRNFENETISFDGELVYNLKDFLLSFPTVFIKNGCWNSYKKMNSSNAIECIENSPYGGSITFEYNEAYENGEVGEKCDVYITCPSYADML